MVLEETFFLELWRGWSLFPCGHCHELAAHHLGLDAVDITGDELEAGIGVGGTRLIVDGYPAGEIGFGIISV